MSEGQARPDAGPAEASDRSASGWASPADLMAWLNRTRPRSPEDAVAQNENGVAHQSDEHGEASEAGASDDTSESDDLGESREPDEPGSDDTGPDETDDEAVEPVETSASETPQQAPADSAPDTVVLEVVDEPADREPSEDDTAADEVPIDEVLDEAPEDEVLDETPEDEVLDETPEDEVLDEAPDVQPAGDMPADTETADTETEDTETEDIKTEDTERLDPEVLSDTEAADTLEAPVTLDDTVDDQAPDTAAIDQPAPPGLTVFPAAGLAPTERRLRIVAAVVLALAVLGIGGALVLARDLVPRGTTIGGVDVGGQRRGEAMATLGATAKASSAAALNVSVGDRQASIDPSKAGLRVDAASSVDAVLGGPLDLTRVWRQLVGGGDEASLPAADTTALRASLTAVAKDTARAPIPGAITFAGDGPRGTAAVTGVNLDIDAAAETVSRSWLSRAGAVELPVKTTQPTVTQAEVDRALAEVAEPAASGPLTVLVGSETVSVNEDALRPTLSMAAKTDAPGTLDLVVNGPALRKAVIAGLSDAGTGEGLERPARDARIVLKGGKPTVIGSVDGVTIDPAALASAARTALLAPDRTARVTPTVTKPKLTTEQAKALGVTERVSTFSTPLTSNVPRTNNLRIAARTVNGTLVLPGATFSLNQVLGRRTPEKGYAEAPVIINGRLVMGHGGGVSQMATTIFNNVFFAGLEDVRHTPHSFYISRYPEGREATVNYPNVDLVWRNDSRHAVLVEAGVTRTVNVSFWSTKQYDDVIAEKGPRTNLRQPKTIYDEGDQCVAQIPTQGFDVTVRRKVIKDGTIVKDQSWFTSYIAEDKVVCGPKPDAVASLEPKPATVGG